MFERNCDILLLRSLFIHPFTYHLLFGSHLFDEPVDAGCQILTLGQYLQPSKAHLPVERYVHPEEFEHWRKTALDMGFRAVASGPMVRSSYQAEDLWRKVEALGTRRQA